MIAYYHRREYFLLVRICGERLRQLRQAAGLSQAALGARAGVSARTIRHSELGQHSAQISNLKAIADALGVPLSALAEPATPQFVGAVPPAPRLVIGREAWLRRMRERLSEASGPTVLAIHGWPGVGKTTLSAALAHDPEVAKMFPSGILWHSLGPAPDLKACLLSWAEVLGVPFERARPPSEQDLGRLISFALKDARALLIVDDAWSVHAVEALRVIGTQCAMVVTTRLPVIADQLTSEPNVIRLDVLSKLDAFTLLSTVVPSIASEHAAMLKQVADEVEGLPLALHVVAGLLRAESRRGFSVEELLDSLRTTGKGARHVLAADVPSDLRSLTIPSVAALIARSTDILSSSLRERFSLLGLFTAKPAIFDEPAVEVLWESQSVRSDLGELVDRGLLEPVPTSRYQIHALLKVHAESLLED